MENENIKKEEFRVSGEDVVAKVKEIVREGHARRIIIENEKGEELLVIPLTIAVVGTVLAPVLAAVGVLAAFLTKCTIVVEKK
ncbi:MAG: hypothetical protein CO002_02000 [Candidatus Portnoybacteria bacterium CG_4_8_14_3_um_filter_44_10]|uniref:DUF4342 domain-containing protein n=5 Tax=Candidatus Portnoyibacteriota TaxID=1817913 RepID=A0A2H0KQU3_9BACT|nr:MAG: hypothetical protein AUK17_00955 [Parcubacteria group bacterium CG2_30_44_18]PIQ74477.1 MAG: hypothetical protein COV85_01875 [Candidatus Portnoybacteria bacterium CG11_big_fil_rev_8_21_14_0_20_44_10]PIS16607.1 MAG: hypothetical protein COT61_03025 [Candidatus Portnoybacteria bacterium CG09_land_8_20_14_0_10_44_13]PIW75448.1 MAG: hypothetical protein CO002_02000 [Candidatus Portnoybacteria bacterium CG_4_8_14_3_um_filter_44_10]PIZ69260.1 MAG: hypothetical protein COY11_04750 [Candidatus